MRNLLITIAVLATAGTPLAAQPIDIVATGAPTAEVVTADLDLSNPAGRRLFEQRLAGAIETVCGSYANAIENSDQQRIADCRSSARVDADRQLASRRGDIRLALQKR